MWSGKLGAVQAFDYITTAGNFGFFERCETLFSPPHPHEASCHHEGGRGGVRADGSCVCT